MDTRTRLAWEEDRPENNELINQQLQDRELKIHTLESLRLHLSLMRTNLYMPK